MRIAYLSPELPYEPGGGGGRAHELLLLRRVRDLGHDVLAISPVLPHERELTASLTDRGVAVWAPVRPASHLEEAIRAAVVEPAILGAVVDRPVLALQMRVFWQRLAPLMDRLREWRPDVAIVGHDMALAWARCLPDDLPAVLSCHDLGWNLYRSFARVAGPPKSWALRAEAWRFRRHVVRELGRYDTAVAVSTVERDQLEEIGRCRVELIPTGVDTRVLVPALEPPTVPPRLLFTGTMSYRPNAEGIGWFAERVWPQVRAELPAAELDVVGKDPPAPVRGLDGRAGVRVHGFVPDMAPHFARANLVVVPILTGSGIRVKIVEAMAAGRAIVSTPTGAEGLEVQDGRQLSIETAPEAFAGAVLRLLRDDGARRAMAAEGRALAERRYDWRALGDDLQRVLAEAAAR
jgi:glycosyltransferase involved in cell wall biosynthesis